MTDMVALCKPLRVAKKHRPIRQRIRVYLAEHDMTQDALATQLGIGASHLSLILAGKRVPSLEIASRLEDLTGIPARDFAEVA